MNNDQTTGTTGTTFTAVGRLHSRTFRVTGQFDSHVAIVEIPHQRQPSATVAFDRAAVIRWAFNSTGSNGDYTYQTYTPAELTACYGADMFDVADDAEGTDTALLDAMEIARRDGTVVLVNTEWFSVKDAGTEYEYALDTIGHDLNNILTFESMANAVEWIETATGHGTDTACLKLAEALEAIGLVEEVTEDDAEEE